jgi:molybdenum cofactor biosynthesis enzyme MoaA
MNKNYYELEPEDNTFKTISIQTTYQCQLKCSNCYLGSMLNNEYLPEVDYYKFADVINRLPTRCDIRFIGAEPTLNKALPALIKLTRQAGHRPSLLTNGLTLRKEKYVKELKNAGLNMLGLSMNGGLDNDMYELFDGGKYANQKMAALENCFKYNILPHINVIVGPDNTHVLKPLINFIVEMALKYNRKFSPIKYPVAFRMKSIGQMGYYMKTQSFSLQQLAELAAEIHEIDLLEVLQGTLIDGYAEERSVIYRFNTPAGTMLGKLTDWNVDDDGIPDAGSKRRGILTEDYKIAPFFEYYQRQQTPCYPDR